MICKGVLPQDCPAKKHLMNEANYDKSLSELHSPTNEAQVNIFPAGSLKRDFHICGSSESSYLLSQTHLQLVDSEPLRSDSESCSIVQPVFLLPSGLISSFLQAQLQ